jgi:hypothetical protein
MRSSGIVLPIEVAIHGNKVTGLHGTHRLGFAVAQGLQTVPMRFLTLDRDLSDLAEMLFYIYDDPKHPYDRMSIYQPLDHPYFELATCWHPEDGAKAVAIIERLQRILPPPAQVTDIGCHLGFYSRALLNAGYDVVSVDNDPVMRDCQGALERIGFRRLNFRFEDIGEYLRSAKDISCVFAIGILHHYHRRGDIGSIGEEIARKARILIAEHEASADSECVAFWNKHGFINDEVVYSGEGRIVHCFAKGIED